MGTHADKTQRTEGRELANSRRQQDEGKQGKWQIEDNRPVAMAQRKLQQIVGEHPRVARLGAVAPVQLRALNVNERENLDDARGRLQRLVERYEDHKTLMVDALAQRGGFGNVLGYFQKLGWGHATEEVERLDALFVELKDLSRRAGLDHKPLGQFLSKVNFLDQSGGMNRFYNIFGELERGLLSQERNDTVQFTQMDEAYFRKYLAASKSPMKVYRGDGRDVTPESFETLSFTDVPAGGTTDISFAGVVEHTHTNTLKNGMVSCTTDEAVALHFATSEHEYDVVWEFNLDNYIHVANLLAARNFKYRFPGQFEVLYPGPIPKGKIVSATLYRKTTPIKTRTA